MSTIDPAIEDEIFLIYDTIDSMLHESAFDACDCILARNIDTLSTAHLLALLSITWPARGALKKRADFVRRVRERLSQYDPSRCNELLTGLE